MLQHRKNTKSIAVAWTIAGGTLASLAALLPLKAAAYPLNPCPGIYYEEPFNSTRIVPQGCPPNAATQRLPGVQAQPPVVILPGRPTPVGRGYPVQPPLPESQEAAIATVSLNNNSFDARVVNNTNALVSYEVVGQTQRRYLRGGEEALLQGIPAPATITFTRQDNGYVEVLPVSSSESGLLAIQLNEDATPLDDNQGVLRIQANGQVLLN